jgi:ankyrin repeat protein
MKQILIYFLFLFTINKTSCQEILDGFTVARNGTLVQAQQLLKQNPNGFNIINAEGFSPLIIACYRGNVEVAKFLIELGCNINQKSNMGTPLMAAVVKGNAEIIQYLILKNADVNISDVNGTTALIYAVQFNNIDVVKILIKQNADKNHKDNQGKTAFEYAVFAGNEDIINVLK